MRVFCVCLCLLALTSTIYGDDDAASPTTAAPAPGGGAAQETSTTVDSTTTQEATTSKPDRTSPGKGGETIQQYLEGDEEIEQNDDQSLKCKDIWTDFVNPTPYQVTNECRQNKHVKQIDGFVYVKESAAENNKYQCCIDTSKVCPGDNNKPIIEPTTGSLLSCNNNHKEFTCSLKSVCHISFQKDGVERDAFQKKMGMQKDYSIGDICCPRVAERSEKCGNKSPIRVFEPSNNICEANKGRCSHGNKHGVCSQTDYSPDRDSSCCEVAEQDLCPGKLLPFAFQIIENQTTEAYKGHHTAFDYRFGKKDTDTAEKNMKQSCREIKDGGGAYLYPNEDEDQTLKAKQCCPYAELSGEGGKPPYIATVNLAYEKYSKIACDANNNCQNKALYCGPAKDPTLGGYENGGRMCFPRVECPHVQEKVYSNPNKGKNDLNCDVGSEGQCAEGDVCMSMLNGTLGVCCSATAYGYKCAAADGGPEAEGTGAAVQKAKCVNDPNDKYVHKSVTVEGNVKICCRWNKAGSAPGPQGTPPSVPPGFTGSMPTVKPTASSGECQNNGKYIYDTQSMPKECGAGAKEAGSCEGKGVCRKSSRNQKLYCCDENRCPTDNFTPMDGLHKCDDKDSACKDFSESQKVTYCPKDNKGEKRCCPIPSAKGNKIHSDVMNGKIKSFKLPGTKCKDAGECGGNGKYCRDNVCWNYGSNSLFDINSRCTTNDDCKSTAKITYYCIKMGSPNDHGTCAHHTKVVDAKKTTIKLGYVIGAITNAIFAIIFGLLAVVMFLKYRSKNFCDQRKPSKKDKKKSKKSEKTETTGGDTTGGTTSKADK